MTDKNFVEAECGSCRGTGIYRGFAEPKGVGVVCLSCDGSGCKRISYTPFTARKRRDDVQTVQLSAGSLLVTGVGPRGSAITYREFLEGKLPRNAS